MYFLVSRDLFLGAGLDHLTVIVNEKCCDAALRIVANVTPIFFSCPEKLTQEARCVVGNVRWTSVFKQNVIK